MLDRLRYPITIESPSTTQDSFGQSVDTWTTVRSPWADIRAVTSKEVYALGAGFTSQVTHKITVRYSCANITAGMRVRYCDRTFAIQAVSDPDEQKMQLNLMCLEQSK